MILYWYLCNSLYHVLMRKYLHFCNDLVCIKDAKEMTSCAVVRVIEQSCFNSVPDLLFLHKFLIQLLLVCLKYNWLFDHWEDLEHYWKTLFYYFDDKKPGYLWKKGAKYSLNMPHFFRNKSVTSFQGVA